IEDDDRPRLHLLLLDVDAPRDRLHSGVESIRGDRRRVPKLVARILVRGLDRRTRERVVELVEEHELPRTREIVERVVAEAERSGDRTPLLGAQEQVLGAPVPALDPRVRRVAAARVVLELAAERWNLAVGVDAVEEPAQRAQLEPRQAAALVEVPDALEVRDRRAAAVVADAVEDGVVGRAV